MKRRKFSSTVLSVQAAGLLVLLLCCASAPSLVGMWRQIGKKATLEFSRDGSFNAVDNEGMAVSGKYTVLENSKVKFEILHSGSSAEVIILNVSVKGDVLTVDDERPGQEERYRRLER
jgi:hypothetical protein